MFARLIRNSHRLVISAVSHGFGARRKDLTDDEERLMFIVSLTCMKVNHRLR